MSHDFCIGLINGLAIGILASMLFCFVAVGRSAKNHDNTAGTRRMD